MVVWKLGGNLKLNKNDISSLLFYETIYLHVSSPVFITEYKINFHFINYMLTSQL